MANGWAVRRSLDRDAQLHLGMDAAAHLVGARLCEGYAKLSARLLESAVEIQAFAGHGDVVRGPVLVDEYYELSLREAQLLDVELQVFLGHRYGRGGTDARGQQHRGRYAKQLR